MTADVPGESYEFKRVETPLVYDEIVWLRVPIGFYWLVDAVQVNLNTDATVGSRNVDIYVMSSDRQTLYLFGIQSAAGFVNKCVHQPGMPHSSVSGLERLFTGPWYAPVLPFPCAIGARWHNFQGAGDHGDLYAFVREYRA